MSVQIFALDGKKVRTLINESREPGEVNLDWNGKNDAGQRVPSGAYFCRLESGTQVDTRKLLMLK